MRERSCQFGLPQPIQLRSSHLSEFYALTPHCYCTSEPFPPIRTRSQAHFFISLFIQHLEARWIRQFLEGNYVRYFIATGNRVWSLSIQSHSIPHSNQKQNLFHESKNINLDLVHQELLLQLLLVHQGTLLLLHFYMLLLYLLLVLLLIQPFYALPWS